MKRIAFLAAAMLILTGCRANDNSSVVEKMKLLSKLTLQKQVQL